MWAVGFQYKRMFNNGFLYRRVYIIARFRRSIGDRRVLDMEYPFKEVDFATYCPKCKYEDVEDIKDPCNECLDYPMNENTVKPVNYIPKKKG